MSYLKKISHLRIENIKIFLHIKLFGSLQMHSYLREIIASLFRLNRPANRTINSPYNRYKRRQQCSFTIFLQFGINCAGEFFLPFRPQRAFHRAVS